MSEKYENADLSHELGKQLFRLMSRQRAYMRQPLAELGLKGYNYRYVISLHRRPGISQDALAEIHSVDKSRVARAARELELLGCVRRLPDESDRRYYRLYLTPRGDELYREIRDILSDWGKRITGDIPVADLETTVRTLELMTENAKKKA